MNRRKLVIALTGLGISPVVCLSKAWPADNYPSKPIRIDIVHVPYRDGSMALNDVVAGHTSTMFNRVTTSKGFVDSGKLVPLLATGTERLSPFPNTPSATEAGLAGLAISGWAGFTAPISTPKPILDRLYAELMRIITGPELKIAIADAGATVIAIANTPEPFTAVIKSEQRAFAELVKLTGAKIE